MKKFIAILLTVLMVATIAPAALAATNGNYQVTVKGYYNGKLTTLTTAFVPYGGNTLAMAYRWDAQNYRFILEATEGASYVTINNNIKYVNNRNMYNTSFTYTTPSTGNGSATKYLYGNAITSAQRTVQVNIGTIGSVTTTVDATYGKKLIKASDLQSEITALLESNSYNASDFDFTQLAYTEFTYKGCSNVNFAFNGSIVKPSENPTEAPATTAPTAAPTATPDPKGDCTLKVWASTPGSEEGSPTYNAPFTTKIKSGENYTWLSPEQYGIIVSEGYQLDYYYDNAERHIGSTSYVASNLSGWSAVAYFKQKTITDKAVEVEYKTEDGTVVAVANTTVSGLYWTDCVINGSELFKDTDAAKAGYQIVGSSTLTVKPGKVGSKVAFTVEKPVVDNAPVIEVNGATLTATENKDQISLMAVAMGRFDSYKAMKAEPSFKSITSKKAYTANGLTEAKEFTVYMRMASGDEYFKVVTLIPTPPVLSSMDRTIYVAANADSISVMYVCHGVYSTYAEMKADKATNGFKNVTANEDGKYEYLALMSKELETYTYYIVMNDGSTYTDQIDVDATVVAEFELVCNGMSVTINDECIDMLANMWSAKGTYTSYSAMKNAGDNEFKTTSSKTSWTRTFTGITETTDITVIVKDTYGDMYYLYADLTPANVTLVQDGNNINLTDPDNAMTGMWIAPGHFGIDEYALMKATEGFKTVTKTAQTTGTVEITVSGEWTVRMATSDGNVVCYYFNIA